MSTANEGMLGERYLDTIYRASWLQDHYGDDVLGADELPVPARSRAA